MLLGGGLCYCLLATAATDESLPRQIEQLRRQLHELETRIQQLEQSQHAGSMPAGDTAVPAAATSRARAAPAAAATGAAPVSPLDPALQSLGRLKDAWKGISSGMNQPQVRERLGDPDRELKIDGKPVWHYSYPGVGSGSVVFSVVGRVIGVQQPPFSFW